MKRENMSVLAPGLALIGCVIGWTALLVEVGLIIYGRMLEGAGFAAAAVFVFSFFSIPANILVALCHTATLSGGRRLAFFRLPTVRAAALLYMVVVGLVYATVLAGVWKLPGIVAIANDALHYVAPPLYALWWLVGAPKGRLGYAELPRWMLPPTIYLAYVVLRGAATGEYPYPFFDIAAIGTEPFLGNVAALGATFLAVGLAIVALDGRLARVRARRGIRCAG